MPARRLFNERSISFFINRRQISLTQRGEKGLRPMALVIRNLIKMPLYRQTGDCASSVIAHSRGETRHSFALPGVMPTPPVGSHALILRVRQPGVLSGLTEHEGLAEQRNTPARLPRVFRIPPASHCSAQATVPVVSHHLSEILSRHAAFLPAR